MPQAIEQWDYFEASFEGPSAGNPFLDVAFEATFAFNNREVTVPGFYDGEGIYRVRFMPDAQGTWRFRTRSNAAALDGKTGEFRLRRAGRRQSWAGARPQSSIISPMPTARLIFRSAPPATPGRISRWRCRSRR